jgi:hypothetical protein
MDGDFENHPKNAGFHGFHMKSMVEKHAKPLQGFAQEVIFDNPSNSLHTFFSSLCPLQTFVWPYLWHRSARPFQSNCSHLSKAQQEHLMT